MTATHYYIFHFLVSLVVIVVHFIQVRRKEEVKTKWLIWLLLDAQIFVQKDLSTKNTANTFFFPTVLHPCFIPISSMAWKFPRSPFREELFLIRTGCSEIAEQKPTIFRFSRGCFRSFLKEQVSIPKAEICEHSNKVALLWLWWRKHAGISSK